MRGHSLTHRVVLLVIVVELLCAGCFSGVALWHEWRTRVQTIDAVLQGRSDSLLGAIQDAEDPADNVFIDPTELKLPDADRYSVYNQAGILLGGNERSAFPLTRESGNGVRSSRFNGQNYRVLERKALRIIDRPETNGVGIRRPITIVYAIPISTAHLWHQILRTAGFYIVSSLVFTAVTALVLLALIRRLLQPVAELAASATGISPTTLTFRPPASAKRVKELQPLVVALSSTINGLREAFEKQERFVSDAAHELKTAVAVVRSSIQVLNLRTRNTEEYKAGLDAVLEDNERVETLVARMLQLAHAEETPHRSGELSDLAQTVEQTVQELKTYATARQVSVDVSLMSATVQLAAEDVRTVLTNLIVNAIQHSDECSRVAVRVFLHPEETNAATLEVEDFGEGIQSKDLPLLFDRFYRADTSRSRQTGGAGLGLAICKRIVDAAGGRIELESELGCGTTARVTLPLASKSIAG